MTYRARQKDGAIRWQRAAASVLRRPDGTPIAGYGLVMDIDEQKRAADLIDAALEQCDLSGVQVLLVEDNELNREIARTLLEMRGMEVETAEDGQEAADLYRSRGAGYFSAVLMDIRMPRMDGLEATRAIRAMEDEGTDSIPILAMTANAFEEDKARAYEAGMNGYLVKPLDMEAVLDELKKHL